MKDVHHWVEASPAVGMWAGAVESSAGLCDLWCGCQWGLIWTMNTHIYAFPQRTGSFCHICNCTGWIFAQIPLSWVWKSTSEFYVNLSEPRFDFGYFLRFFSRSLKWGVFQNSVFHLNAVFAAVIFSASTAPLLNLQFHGKRDLQSESNMIKKIVFKKVFIILHANTNTTCDQCCQIYI